MPDLKRIRQAVEGYLALGLPDMAEEELAALPDSLAGDHRILDAQLAIQLHRREWPKAIETGLAGCAAFPGDPSFFIHTAYCLHELGRTEEAHLLLMSGPSSLHREPLYHYNMGCYLTVLGREGEAATHLGQAFRLDGSLRGFAKKDRDLEPLWPTL